MGPIKGPAILHFGKTETYLVLRGELDAADTRKLHAQLIAALESSLPIVVEMSATTFVAAQIWNLLYSFRHAARVRGIAVRVVSASWTLPVDVHAMRSAAAIRGGNSVWPTAMKPLRT